MRLKKKDERIRISRACIIKKPQINGGQQVSSHPNRFTYRYLRCMRGVELCHQKGRLKGHLRTAGSGREGRSKKWARENKITDTSHLRDTFD